MSSCSENSTHGCLGTIESISLETQRLRVLAENAPIMIWSTGKDKLCEYFNQSWLDFRGRSLEQEAGSRWADGVHPDDVAACLSARDAAFERRANYQIEYRLLRHDSVYRWILEMGAPWYRPAGMFHGYVGSCIDIHERRQERENLKNRNDALSLQLDELIQFTYAAAHDLQEPLRTIAGYTRSLAKEVEAAKKTEICDDSPGAELTSAVLESVRRMQALIADVLVYSHILHRSELTLAELDTNAVLERVLLSCGATIEANAALITRDPLPSVYADEAQLGRVLQNLIGNAIKYRSCGRPPRIHISAVSGEDEWRFEVADNGIGFDPQYSGYIFGLMKRLHGQGEYSGSGMGLAICKRIVERHGGRIWAISEPQRGSRFFFTLPRRPPLAGTGYGTTA